MPSDALPPRRLRAGREQHPLFDTRLLTGDLERGLLMSWDVQAMYGPGGMHHLVVAETPR